jgi:hypothetical protein
MRGFSIPQYASLAHFTLGVKANVQLKLSIPIDPKVEISPKGFRVELFTTDHSPITDLFRSSSSVLHFV